MNELPKVYDLFYPSPPTLEKIAMIKIATELWRQEIRNHCANGTLKELNFENTTLSSVLNSYIPESMLSNIEEYIKIVGLSIKQWMKCHTKKLSFQFKILNDFNDFVGDFDGSIDYEKTAKKMILCDGISQVEKFKIACQYCFEDEIALLWPAVSTRIDLGEFKFSEFPHLFFWICRLKNQLYMVPVKNFAENVGKNFFDFICSTLPNKYSAIYWSSMKYIFDRIDSDERMHYVTEILTYDSEKFYRYILAKLSKCEFDELLMKNRSLLWDLPVSRAHNVMAIWMYVKDEINKNEFVELIKKTLYMKPISSTVSNEPSISSRLYASVPDDFKQCARERALLDNSHFSCSDSVISVLRDQVSLLLTALSEASYDDRKTFRERHCLDMMFVMNINEFHQFVALCVENEEEMDHFRETRLSDWTKTGPIFLELFKMAKFEKLNGLISYCYPQILRDIRLSLLNSNYDIFEECSKKPYELMKESRALNEFIDDTFEDADRVTEFKNQFVLRYSIVGTIKRIIERGFGLRAVREFIDTMMSKQIVMNFKRQRILPVFKPRFLYGLLGNGYEDDYDYDVKFLRWCLEDEDGNVDSSQAIPVGEIIQAVLRREMWRKRMRNPLKSSNHNVRAPMTYHSDLVEFLKWYLVTNEAYDNLVAKYAYDDAFAKLTKPNDRDVQ